MKNLYGYNPLKNIIFADDFDEGYNGWLTLMPNFRQDKFDYYDSFKGWTSWGPPMLSSATFPYAGTHGSLHGTYSMKIATRPVAAPAENRPVAAILCVPMSAAEKLADTLIECGIKAFWNFTHYDLKVTHKGVAVENVHLGDSLTTLSYCLNNLDEKSKI